MLKCEAKSGQRPVRGDELLPGSGDARHAPPVGGAGPVPAMPQQLESGMHPGVADVFPDEDAYPISLRVLRTGCCVLAAGVTVLVLTLMLVRASGRFDNEWIESSMAGAAVRVMNGQQLYGPPSVEFVGDNYPPLYVMVCGGLMKVFGPSLTVCRLVSVLATLAIAWAIWTVAGLHSGQARQRFIWVGLFFAFYAAGGQFYEVARVDMLAIAAAAWGLVVLLRSTGMTGAVVGGLCMALAILTKHNMVLVGAAVDVALLLSHWRRALVYGLIAAGLPALVFTWLQATSDGWCWFYLFTQPSMHPFGDLNSLLRLVSQDLGHHGLLLIVELVAAGVILRRGIGRGGGSLGIRLVLLAVIGGVLATLVGRLKVGGFANNLCVAWVFAVLAGAYVVPRARAWLSSEYPSGRMRLAWAFWVITAVQLISLSSQYASLPWGAYVGWAERQRAAAELEGVIAGYAREGPVWVPAHSFFSRPTAAFAHFGPVFFLTDRSPVEAKSRFEADLIRHLEERRWSAILLDRPADFYVSQRCGQVLEENYRQVTLPVGDPQRCAMLTGDKTYPQYLFVRRGSP